MVRVRGAHHRRGERRNERHEAETEHNGAGKDIGEPRRMGTDPREEQEAGCREQGSEGELQSRSDALRERPRRRRQRHHEHRGRQQRDTGAERRPSRGDLQLVRDEEERHPDRPVEQHGRKVHDRERAVAEQRRWHERVVGVQQPPHERAHCDDGDHGTTEHRRVRPSARSGFREGPRSCPEPRDREGGAHHVESSRGMWIPGLGHRRVRARDDDGRDRHVDEECPAPSGPVDEKTAEERSECAGHAAEPGPRPDRRRAIFAPEARLDDRETSRSEQRTPDALQDPRADEHLDVRRRTAQQ